MKFHPTLAIVLVLSAAAGAAPPATAPFTVGPDTTVVTGPLLPDGTIDYVAAINAELAKGVTAENNAATIFFGIADPGPEVTRSLTALHAKPQLLAQPLRRIDDYARATSKTVYDYDALSAQQRSLMQRPWKPGDSPLISGWLDASAPALALARTAADLPQCHIPWVSAPPNDGWNKAIPSTSPLSLAANALIIRAMRYAGANDFLHARDDLRATQKIGAIAARGRTEIAVIADCAIQGRVLQAYAGMITALPLTTDQFDAVEAELRAFPSNALTNAPLDIEGILPLASVMLCIRGQEADILRATAQEFSPEAAVNPGDLHRADWNVVLQTVVSVNDQITRARAFPDYATRHAALAQLAAHSPAPDLWNLSNTDAEPHKARNIIEAYLRQPPIESIRDYSVRLGYLIGQSPQFSQRFDAVLYVPTVRRQLALLTIASERYHQRGGSYPAALKDIAADSAILDPFSNKSFHYKTTNDTFTLYSVGVNAKDDNAAGDDLVVTSMPVPIPPLPPPTPLTPAHANSATQTQ